MNCKKKDRNCRKIPPRICAPIFDRKDCHPLYAKKTVSLMKETVLAFALDRVHGMLSV